MFTYNTVTIPCNFYIDELIAAVCGQAFGLL